PTDAAAPATPPALTALPEAAAEESETPAVTDAAALLNSADVQEAAALAQLPGFPAFPNLPGMPTTP
ncbi:hypothetical protein, partial [Yinghuangia sp. YIM S10712]|uniref:hypothetical protein n=1 Tax=Yinghuangia sp. YIM S10712 TaxID=3436930 RepID=UPI003F539FDB